MRTMTIAMLTFLALAVAGCSDDGDSSGNNNNTVNNNNANNNNNNTKKDGGVTPDQKVSPDTAPAKAATVCGYTEDTSGALLTSHPVIVCNDHVGCFSDDSSSTGQFCVQIDTAAEYVAHATITKKGSVQYLDTYFPVTVTQADIDAEKKIEVGKLVVAQAGKDLQKVDIAKGGTYDLGGGVSVTIGAGATKKPPLEPDAKIGAGVLPKAKVNARASANYSGSGTLAFAVAFATLETTFTSPVSYKFPATGLADGDKVEVFFLSEHDGKLTDQGEGEVKSGSVVNASGKGLTKCGVFLVFKK